MRVEADRRRWDDGGDFGGGYTGVRDFRCGREGFGESAECGWSAEGVLSCVSVSLQLRDVSRAYTMFRLGFPANGGRAGVTN